MRVHNSMEIVRATSVGLVERALGWWAAADTDLLRSPRCSRDDITVGVQRSAVRACVGVCGFRFGCCACRLATTEEEEKRNSKRTRREAQTLRPQKKQEGQGN